jgi:hypothetical protein
LSKPHDRWWKWLAERFLGTGRGRAPKTSKKLAFFPGLAHAGDKIGIKKNKKNK